MTGCANLSHIERAACYFLRHERRGLPGFTLHRYGDVAGVLFKPLFKPRAAANQADAGEAEAAR